MRTLKHLPEPYPDECLYSYLDRVHRRSVNVNWPTSCIQIFGRSRVQFTPYMFHHFRELSEHTGLPEDLLFQMSGANFYLSFLNRDLQEPTRARILGSGSNILGSMGIKKNSRKRGLYYCPVCMSEDKARYGIPYFHLIHQLDGVRACPKHGCCLEVYPNLRVDGQKPICFDITDANAVNAQTTDIQIAKLAGEVAYSHGLCREMLVSRYHYEASLRGMEKTNGSVISVSLRDHLDLNINEAHNLFHFNGLNVSPYIHLQLWEEWGLHADDFFSKLPEQEEIVRKEVCCPICHKPLTHLTHRVEKGKHRDSWHCVDCDLYANTYDSRLHIAQYGKKFFDWMHELVDSGMTRKEVSRISPFNESVIYRLFRTGDATPVNDRLREMEKPDTSYNRRTVMDYTKQYDPAWHADHQQMNHTPTDSSVDWKKRDQDLLEKAENVYPALCEKEAPITIRSFFREMGLSYNASYKTKCPAFYKFISSHSEHGSDHMERLVRLYIFREKEKGHRVSAHDVKKSMPQSLANWFSLEKIQKIIDESYECIMP